MKGYLSVKLWQWWHDHQFFKVFSDKEFQKVDRCLKREYRWKNPYRISREFYEAIGDRDIYQYGETPLITMGKIARALELKKGDHLYEYGSGRGRTSFFLNHYFHCKVTAIEKNPIFIQKAKKVANECAIDIDFLEADFLTITPEKGASIYLYGTCLDDRVIYELCEKFPKGVKVATVSYPLCEYDRRFHVQEKLKVQFPWGETEAYINV